MTAVERACRIVTSRQLERDVGTAQPAKLFLGGTKERRARALPSLRRPDEKLIDFRREPAMLEAEHVHGQQIAADDAVYRRQPAGAQLTCRKQSREL